MQGQGGKPMTEEEIKKAYIVKQQRWLSSSATRPSARRRRASASTLPTATSKVALGARPEVHEFPVPVPQCCARTPKHHQNCKVNPLPCAAPCGPPCSSSDHCSCRQQTGVPTPSGCEPTAFMPVGPPVTSQGQRRPEASGRRGYSLESSPPTRFARTSRLFGCQRRLTRWRRVSR